MAGYGVRAFLVAQSLNQIDKAYGANHAILDNCHVRVAFAPNDERTAKRLSDALGTATELRRQQERVGPPALGLAAARHGVRAGDAAAAADAGRGPAAPADDALVLVSGTPPIRASKLQYYADRNFLARCLPPPPLSRGRYARRAAAARRRLVRHARERRDPELRARPGPSW